jgi:N-acylglucosamine-6-phosphate 2-epimerase
MTIDPRVQQLHRGLVVSCQPLPGSAMDRPEIVLAMALAAVDGGAAGLRIEGVEHVRRVAARVPVPVVGIVKRDLTDSPVRITPFLEDVDALAEAGAALIAIDATRRTRPATVAALLERIHGHGCVSMADASNLDDGLAAWTLGVDLVGTTLSGYTEATRQAGEEPDLALIAALAARGCRVVAEGRIRTPQQAAQARAAGAWCVTVGSAITRIEHITGWFRDALHGGSAT